MLIVKYLYITQLNVEKSNIYLYILCGKVYKMSNLFHDAQGRLRLYYGVVACVCLVYWWDLYTWVVHRLFGIIGTFNEPLLPRRGTGIQLMFISSMS